MIRAPGTPEAEGEAVVTWLKALARDGVQPHEIAVFVRSVEELPRARAAVEQAGLPLTVLDERVETQAGHVAIGTMHLAAV